MRLDHLAIAVPDLDAALAFYRDGLGLTCARVEDVEREGVRIAFLPVGESEIELLQPTRQDTGIVKWLAKHGPGMHHVCLEVGDIQAAMARIQRAGGEMINPEPVRRPEGTLYAFVHPRSTGGVLIELYQRPPQP
ncbi:MAG: methylmalonyl-CoA epimerase [Thermoflexales bacterium]|nr:methylmalonyl-CoA epimerase [Thermoflexales bacterium]